MNPITIIHITEETRRAKDKHKVRPNTVEEGSLERCVAILGEEFGEVAKCVLDMTRASRLIFTVHERADLYKELTQVASVATRWMERIQKEEEIIKAKAMETGNAIPPA